MSDDFLQIKSALESIARETNFPRTVLATVHPSHVTSFVTVSNLRQRQLHSFQGYAEARGRRLQLLTTTLCSYVHLYLSQNVSSNRSDHDRALGIRSKTTRSIPTILLFPFSFHPLNTQTLFISPRLRFATTTVLSHFLVGDFVRVAITIVREFVR